MVKVTTNFFYLGMLERQTATSRPLRLRLILLGTLLSEVATITCHNKLYFLVFL